MKYISTRSKEPKISLSEAIRLGLAKDGGLFVPEQFPTIDFSEFTKEDSFADFTAKLLTSFFKDDSLEESVSQFCASAFDFPFEIRALDNNTWCLELFHGPTLAFKDFGARFLAECLNEIARRQNRIFTILVATSGDTGSAVASAFHNKMNTRAIILFPRGRISKRQEKQLTCWDNNILSVSVDGRFDDCQLLVKSAFDHAWWQEQVTLTTANSINVARLLPQMAYYAYTSFMMKSQGTMPCGFVVPSGNFGNATGAYWAKALGFPLREIVMPTNANRVLFDYLNTGTFEARQSIATLANAMDVGRPSNLERIDHLFPSWELLQENVASYFVSDDTIKSTIEQVYKEYEYVICPHTATGFHVKKGLADLPWVIASTADPVKFDSIVEPIIGKTLSLPKKLKELLDKPTQCVEIDNSMDALIDVVTAWN